jgi:hypothetical protein
LCILTHVSSQRAWCNSSAICRENTLSTTNSSRHSVERTYCMQRTHSIPRACWLALRSSHLALPRSVSFDTSNESDHMDTPPRWCACKLQHVINRCTPPESDTYEAKSVQNWTTAANNDLRVWASAIAARCCRVVWQFGTLRMDQMPSC